MNIPPRPIDDTDDDFIFSISENYSEKKSVDDSNSVVILINNRRISSDCAYIPPQRRGVRIKDPFIMSGFKGDEVKENNYEGLLLEIKGVIAILKL